MNSTNRCGSKRQFQDAEGKMIECELRQGHEGYHHSAGPPERGWINGITGLAPETPKRDGYRLLGDDELVVAGDELQWSAIEKFDLAEIAGAWIGQSPKLLRSYGKNLCRVWRPIRIEPAASEPQQLRICGPVFNELGTCLFNSGVVSCRPLRWHDASIPTVANWIAENLKQQHDPGLCQLCGTALSCSDVLEYGPKRLKLHERCVVEFSGVRLGFWVAATNYLPTSDLNDTHIVQKKNGVCEKWNDRKIQECADQILYWWSPAQPPLPPDLDADAWKAWANEHRPEHPTVARSAWEAALAHARNKTP